MILDEFDSNKEAIINPSDLISKVDNIPSVAIACYSKDLFDNIVAGGKCNEISFTSNTNGKKKIYDIEYKGLHFTLFNINIGAPMAAVDIEDMHEKGCNKFIVFGNCGVLDNDIDDCSVIIPKEAIRDEGTSYHYMPVSRTVLLNQKYMNLFKDILNEFGYSYTEGMTWTTDAFYRETRDKVERRKKEGAIVVEMESSALQAVCNFRGIDLFTFFYAGDNLDLEKWDKRSLSGEIKLDEKSRIVILALELAYRISKDTSSL